MNDMVRISPQDLVAVALRPLKAGETVQVRIAVPVEDLMLWDAGSHGWALKKGRTKIMIGASSQDIRLRKRIRL